MNFEKSFKSVFMVTVMMGFGASAFAQDGSGVRGGGHVVDVDGAPELIEFVKGTTCSWKRGTRIIEENREISKTLDRLAQYDWYFAESLKQQVGGLNFCFTGPLLRLSPVDPKSPVATTLMLKGKYRQAAVRVGQDVFVDESIYRSLLLRDPSRAAALMIHEGLHSFFSMELPTGIRYLSLWTMSKGIALAGQAPINSREGLHEEMYQNRVDFPRTVEDLDPYRTQVQFLMGTFEENRAAVLASNHPEDLIKDYEIFGKNLVSWDQAWISQWGGPEGVLKLVIQKMFKEGTQDEFDQLLKKKFDRINPMIVALSVMDHMSEVKKAKILASNLNQKGLAAALSNIKNMKVTQGDLRIMASPELALLLGSKTMAEIPLTSLSQTITQTLDVEIIVQVVSGMILKGEWDALDALVKNSDFHQAFTFEIQKQAVSEMNPVVALEKNLALRFLRSAGQNLLQNTLDRIQSKVSEEQFTHFQSLIQTDQF
jgi:hypothetical protein